MASTPPALSISDVERLLEEKKSHLERLVGQREQLQKRIDDLDRQMQAAVSLEGPRRRMGRPRLSNVAPLRTVVLEVLKKNKKGLVLSELTTKVIEAGYKSQSANFQNVIYQCLYYTPEIEQDASTKRYSLKK